MSKICEYEYDFNHEFFGCDTCLHNMKLEQKRHLIEDAQEKLGDKWEDFKEYVDGIDNWGMSDVERYMNRMTQPNQSELEQKLDEVLAVFANYDESCEPGYEDVVLSRIERAKQAIKQLIASELGAIVNANTDENGTDSDRVWEVLMEWMGELQGGGDE